MRVSNLRSLRVAALVALCAFSGAGQGRAQTQPSKAAGVSVPLVVKEPAGVARTNEPASGGVPFAPGQVKDVGQLRLLDAAGRPVPAQFSKLAGHDDGSVQWALVDVLTDVPANGRTEYRLTTGRAAAPPKPLKIEEDAETILVDTGVVRFTVGKRAFRLFDTVSVGGTPIVTGGALLLGGGRGEWSETDPKTRQPVVRVNDAHAGRTYAAGVPTRVLWEYRGPLRATLRIDGDYVEQTPRPLDTRPAERWLSYTTRITAWAGSGAVRVQHSLRNSNPAAGDDAFIDRATLSLDLAVDVANQGRGPGWSAGGNGAVGLLIQNRHTAGVYRGPGTYLRKDFESGLSQPWTALYGQEVAGRTGLVEIVSSGPDLRPLIGAPAASGPDSAPATSRSPAVPGPGALGFTQAGVFALADRAHKDSEVWFDFYTGVRDPAANAARAAALRSKLLLVAPGEWYSETEGLSIGHFGTLADEIACYRKWNWKGWDEAKRYPRLAHNPDAFVPVEMIHDVSEDDAVEGYLLQFLRTGERGFFDWAEAWAGFYRGHAVYRRDWGPRWGLEAPRGERVNHGLRFDWYSPHQFDWVDSRMHNCHEYGRGLFDYYCLTGEVDALDAGLDLAEEMSAGWQRSKANGELGLGRAFGRQFLTVLSAWKVTRDPQWKKIAEHWTNVVLKAGNWDEERGLFPMTMGIYDDYFIRDWAVSQRGRPPIPPRLEKYLKDHGTTVVKERGAVMGVSGQQKWEVRKLTQVFELSACHMAFERAARLLGSEAMKQRVVGMARGVRDYYWSTKCQHVIGLPFLNWPAPGRLFDPGEWIAEHDACPGPGATHSGYSTRYAADIFARAYSFTHDPAWLAWAKRAWDRGAKRGYQTKAQAAAENEVGEFAYVRGAHDNTLTECSARLFYEAARAE
jgi:hypothetical protein